MATAHHIAVIKNSCVKPPINPETGLSATINERQTLSLSEAWHGKDDELDDDGENVMRNEHLSRTQNGTILFNKTESILQDVTADLGNLPDDQFYERLIELKKEHKKTLELCEKLYHEKLGYTLKDTNSNPNNLYSENRNNIKMIFETPNKPHDTTLDMVKDMSPSRKAMTAKPPISQGRPQKAKGKHLNTVSGSVKLDKHAWAERASNEHNYWKAPSSASTDYEQSGDELERSFGVERKKRQTLNDSHNSAVSKIEDMWEDFSVDDYAPRSKTVRPRSASLSRISTSSSSEFKDWRHHITIPEPFTMTLRDESKEQAKSRTLQEYERKLSEKEKLEEEECQKKFKANPVPAHVYMPLYDEVVEKQDAQRRYNKESCNEILKSLEKPFKFIKREEEKRKQKKNKFQEYKEETDESKKKVFKARPVPDYLYNFNINEKLAEEEFYRKIRVQMRAEELLRTSSLPPNMAARGEDYVKGRSRQKSLTDKAKRAGLKTETDFRPKINDSVPDFDELHRRFNRHLSMKKNAKEATVCKPFNLRTTQIAGKKYKEYDDSSEYQNSISENKWNFKNSRLKSGKVIGSLSSSMDSIPTKLTQSATLRASATKARMQKKMDEELERLEAERKQRLKEKRLRKHIAKKSAANDLASTLKASTEEKMKEFRESERARSLEYKRYLDELDQRVSSRPLLFERTSQENAKKAAEKRYMATLQRAGIDEDFIKKQSSQTGSSIPNDEYSEDGSNYSQSCNTRSHSRAQSRTHSNDQTNSDEKDYTGDFDDGSEGVKTPEQFSEIEDEVLAEDYDY